MKTHDAKRVVIIIEKPMQSRLTEAMEQAGVTGYSILPVYGGGGRSGHWTRDDGVGRDGMVQVECIIRPDRLNGLLDGIFSVVERHIGVVSISDCQVLRAERF